MTSERCDCPDCGNPSHDGPCAAEDRGEVFYSVSDEVPFPTPPDRSDEIRLEVAIRGSDEALLKFSELLVRGMFGR